MRRLLLCLGLLGIAALAGAPAAAGGEPAAAAPLEIRGEVVRLEIEGGFWGIVGEDGRRYDPGGLPPEFQQPGLKVEVRARAERDRISFRMWGTPIAIERIERLAP
jgi:hypothetical protein